jgi:ferredoxin
VAEDEFILATAYREGFDLPSMCLQGWCYFPQDREAGFILLCTAQPRSDLVIRTHQRAAMRDHRLACRLPTPRG